MGCEASRSVSVEEQGKPDHNNTANTKGPATEKQEYFSELQIDCIRSTWPLVGKNKVEHGCSIFKGIFALEPSLGKVFSFYNENENLMDNAKARSHAVKFMQIIEEVSEHIEDADNPESEIVKQLVLLGAKHGAIQDLELHYFHVFIKCAHVTWMQVLAEEYTEDVRDAWNTLFEFIREKIQDGYNLFMDDKENDMTQQNEVVVNTTTVITNSDKDET